MKISTILSGPRMSVLIAAGLLFGSPTISRAQQSSAVDESLVRAALIVKVFDQLSGQCKAGRGFNDRESTAIAAWESEQNVGAIRTQMSDGTIKPDMQGHIEKGAKVAMDQLGRSSQADNPCALAMSVTKLPQAKFSTTLSRSSTSEAKPEKLSTSGSGATTTESPTSGSSRQPKISKNSTVTSLVATIDSFGFNTRTTMGVGGFLMQDIYPVVLFRNGEALKDVKGLTDSEGLNAHRSANPDKWTKWRRSGGRVELQTSEGWKPLPFGQTYQSLPSQFRLNGTYRSLSGTGNVAIGGSSSVAAWRTYTFSSDGQVVRDGGAGASSGSTVASSRAPNQRGRYDVDGLILRIKYDDGTTEERILITNPKDPKSAIWLDGNGYSRRRS
jgi:hypothetical protein